MCIAGLNIGNIRYAQWETDLLEWMSFINSNFFPLHGVKSQHIATA